MCAPGIARSAGRVTELFIPIRPIGSSPAQPSAMVLSTRDPALLAIVERGLSGPAQKDREAFLVMMLKIVTAMGISSEIEGFTRPPLEMLRTRGSLAAIKAPLDDRFTVLDLGARPRLLFPVLESLVGVAALLVLLFRSGVRRRLMTRPTVEPAPSPGPLPTPIRPRLRSSRRPRRGFAA